jgi:hypothetical protein
MGQEATCTVSTGTERGDGIAQLETAELRFKGAFALRIPFDTIKTFEAKRGKLHVTHTGGTAVFDLGPLAETWALKIRYPRGRLDKLGVKPTSVISVLGVEDDAFRGELEGRTAAVSFGRTRKGSTLIVYGVTTPTQLDRLTKLRETIAQDGAIWVVWPKGQKTLREDDVRRAAKAQGLVDVKVMSFSDTLSGLKLVIPVAQRTASSGKGPSGKGTSSKTASGKAASGKVGAAK